MATLCGWASMDEKQNIYGGKAGDQTGNEVKTGYWHYFGQNVVLRFKDRTKAKKAAQTMQSLCDNNYVGYDQSQRTTLYTEMQKIGWDVSQLKTHCETDCSAIISPVLCAAGISVSKDIYTGNMVSAIMQTNEFTKLTENKYTTSGDYLLTGDIIINERSHAMMVLADGTKSAQEISNVTAYSTAQCDRPKQIFNVGDTVQFIGNRHYTSSDAKNNGKTARPCTAKVTKRMDGKPHPYHLIGATVYGWVNKTDLC